MVEEMELAPKAMHPFGVQQPIYLANEAFGALRGSDGVLGGHHGWAECRCARPRLSRQVHAVLAAVAVICTARVRHGRPCLAAESRYLLRAHHGAHL